MFYLLSSKFQSRHIITKILALRKLAKNKKSNQIGQLYARIQLLMSKYEILSGLCFKKWQNVVEKRLEFVILGDQGVGKTSLLLRYLYDNIPYKPKETIINSQIHAQPINFSTGKRISVKIFDTCQDFLLNQNNQEQSIVQNCSAFIIIYDVSNLNSFKKIEVYKNKIKQISNKPIFIIGNKTDLLITKQRALGLHEMFQKLKEFSCGYYETNSNIPRRTSSHEFQSYKVVGVDLIFSYIITSLLR